MSKVASAIRKCLTTPEKPNRRFKAGESHGYAPYLPWGRFLLILAICWIAATWGMGVLFHGNAEDLVTGVNPKWARGVVNRAPVKAHGGTQPRAPLYFWMIYEGNQAALEYIKKNGTLPIRHKWSVRVAGKVELEFPDEFDLSVGNNSKKNLMVLEGSLKNSGKFQWRTWSRKEHVSKGQWKVEVIYEDDGRAVSCEDHGQLKPCIYTIEIR